MPRHARFWPENISNSKAILASPTKTWSEVRLGMLIVIQPSESGFDSGIDIDIGQKPVFHEKSAKNGLFQNTDGNTDEKYCQENYG